MLIKYQSLKKSCIVQKLIIKLCIKLPQMTDVRKFDDNTTMSFKISNNQLLKKDNEIWKKS